MFDQNQDVLIDSLPYIDEYTPEMEREVITLIEEEMKSFTPGNYLSHLADDNLSFSSPLLQKEWNRMCHESAQGADPQAFPPIDITRYASPRPPPHLQKTNTAWQQALDNANAQLEHLKNRADNLELTLHYGSNAWKVYNEKIEDYRKRLQQHADHLAEQINNVNTARKNKQTQHKSSFEQLEAEWLELVKKNIEIEIACSQLETDVEALKS